MLVTVENDLLGLSSDQFVNSVAGQQSRMDAMRLYRDAMRHGYLRGWDGGPAPVQQTCQEGETLKFTQRLDDGLESESVILPQRSRSGKERHSLCVSSQIGCALGCRFCETARMGFMRNLSAAQIVGQWWTARFAFGVPVSNIVFMGMGEPTDNLDAVIQAIRVLTDRNGAAIASSRICVSTVGRSAGIRRLAQMAREPGFRQLGLAVSINAPNDDVRNTIMPINRSEPMSELMSAMQGWPHSPRRRILIEYVLIPGVNDAPEHGDQLCDYLQSITCTVNVIPYNPRRDSPWEAPNDVAVDRFVERIRSRGQLVKRRRTMGRSVMAACGQLGNASIRGRRRISEASHQTH